MGSIGLRWKLTLTYLMLVAVTAGLGAGALYRFARTRRALESIAVYQGRTIELAVAGLAHSAEMTRLTYEAAITPRVDVAGAFAKLHAHRSAGEALARDIRSSLTTDASRKRFESVESACARYGDALEDVERAVMAGSGGAPSALLQQDLVPRRREVDAQWRAFVAAQREEIRALAAASAEDGARTEREYAWILAASAVGSLLLAGGMTRHVLRPVSETVRTARRIAEGDLAELPQVTRGDELGQLQGAIAEMCRRLREFAERIRGASVALTDASANNWSAARQLLEDNNAQFSATSDVAVALVRMMEAATLVTEYLHAEGSAPPEVRAAADSMSERIARVNRALLEFDAVAKRNDATAKELWSAAETAAHEARALQDIVAWLRVDPRAIDTLSPSLRALEPDAACTGRSRGDHARARGGG